MKLKPAQREEVRMMFGGFCAYCGILLPAKGWHADHVAAVYRQKGYVRPGFRDMVPTVIVKARILRPQNDCIENFFPACAPCNIDKGVESLEDWRAWLQDRMIETMRRNVPNFRHAERFGRISIKPEPLVFWFEKFKPQATS